MTKSWRTSFAWSIKRENFWNIILNRRSCKRKRSNCWNPQIILRALAHFYPYDVHSLLFYSTRKTLRFLELQELDISISQYSAVKIELTINKSVETKNTVNAWRNKLDLKTFFFHCQRNRWFSFYLFNQKTCFIWNILTHLFIPLLD